jgi:hypothetical protein
MCEPDFNVQFPCISAIAVAAPVDSKEDETGWA